MYLFSRIGHLKKIILKGRGFRCGSDEKMMRMWFGLEIDVVGLPPLGYKYLKVSNLGLQMIGSNEWFFISVRHLGLIPLYQKNLCTLLLSGLGQLESCQPSSQNKWRVEEWMCCQITTPGRSIQNTYNTKFCKRKIPIFNRNNLILSWGPKLSILISSKWLQADYMLYDHFLEKFKRERERSAIKKDQHY